MKHLLVIFLSVLGGGIGVEEAYRLFQQKNYKQSLLAYKNILPQYTEAAQQIKFNIAQNYVEIDSIEVAMAYYHQAMEGKENGIRAKAWNNIGQLSVGNNQKEAMMAFKKALQENPNDEKARYNYELLLRLNPQIANEEENEEEQQNPEPEQDNEKEQKNVDYYKKKFDYYGHQDTESQPTIKNYDSIPLERAIELLEQMKANEMKFLQQIRKTAAEKNGDNKQKSEW